jgi:hypothetical protein
VSGRIQDIDTVTEMLRNAYAERARINRRIEELADTLKELSPDYRKTMEKLEG